MHPTVQVVASFGIELTCTSASMALPSSTPGNAVLDVRGQALPGKPLGIPVVRQCVCFCAADVRPAVPSTGKREPTKLIDIVFERVEGAPLVTCQVGQEETGR